MKKNKKKHTLVSLYIAVRHEEKADKCSYAYILEHSGGNTVSELGKQVDGMSQKEATELCLCEAIGSCMEHFAEPSLTICTQNCIDLFLGDSSLFTENKAFLEKWTAFLKRLYSITFKNASDCSEAQSERLNLLMSGEHKESVQKQETTKPKRNGAKRYTIYTDGSCNNLSPEGEGGYAFIIVDQDKNVVQQFSEGELNTTNNRMELKAIIKACKYIPEDGARVEIRSDSQYALNVLSGKWTARANLDLVEEHMVDNAPRLNIQYRWIKGHNGDEMNELCDYLADNEMAIVRHKYGIPLYDYSNSPKIDKSAYSGSRERNQWWNSHKWKY